jgi:hypothetical protein
MVAAYHLGEVGVGAVDRATGRPPARSTPVKKKVPGLHAGQSDSLQDRARVGVPLRVSAMRRLCWRLVLATQQRVERMLAWSTWRRWHQGIAKYWHDKRRSVP